MENGNADPTPNGEIERKNIILPMDASFTYTPFNVIPIAIKHCPNATQIINAVIWFLNHPLIKSVYKGIDVSPYFM